MNGGVSIAKIQDEGVFSITSIEFVEAYPGIKNVVTLSTFQSVVTLSTFQSVVAVIAIQDVVVGATL